MPLLKISGLQKSYKNPQSNSKRIVDMESFEIKTAEHVGIIGRSGCGKSTFLNLIAGILKADSGSIIFKDTDICTLKEAAKDKFRALHIGYIFQTFNLLQNFTALENVAIGMHYAGGKDKSKAEEMLTKVGLAEYLHYFPNQLSVGQQQRLAVARALVNSPELIIADEPTGNLDSHFAGEAMKLIRQMATQNDSALLVVSHNPHLLEGFDRIIEF